MKRNYNNNCFEDTTETANDSRHSRLAQHQMGEVGTNSSDNPHADLKMNGGINGNCEDDSEAMDVDAQDPTIGKNADSSEQLPAANDSNNVVESENGGNSSVELVTSENENENEHENVKTKENESENENDKQNDDEEDEDEDDEDDEEQMAHENGAEKEEEKCDQDPAEEAISDDSIEKNAIEEVNESDIKIDENADSPVKVSSDPLSADAEPIDDDKRTNQSQPQSTENGTSATITSSNDKKGRFSDHKPIQCTDYDNHNSILLFGTF